MLDRSLINDCTRRRNLSSPCCSSQLLLSTPRCARQTSPESPPWRTGTSDRQSWSTPALPTPRRHQRYPQPLHPTTDSSHHARKTKPGAQGRIRTSVARKERQIYSLLPLTTRPPVHVRPSKPALTDARSSRYALERRYPRARKRQSLLSKNHDTEAHVTGNSVQQLRISRANALARALLRSRKLLLEFSSLGELRVSLGLAPATPCGALNESQSWSWRRDLNPRPSDYKSDALPAELRQPASLRGTIGAGPACSILPAGTNIEGNTTATHVQANVPLFHRWILRLNGDPQLATPVGPQAGILQSAPARAGAVVRSFTL